MAMRLLYYIGKNYISNAGTQQIPTQKHSKLRRFPVQFAENWEAGIASYSERF